ncbi:TPA: CRISPR locus-related DNA-binding protein [Candidatus Bathyarchaeota archaeon]|nr:CRISPR locus-related DNA-binding protein [Candidatus Bathyarchaeota archaeon]
MELKAFFITLGWTETPGLASITKHGLQEGDEVHFLVPSWEDRGVADALSSLKALIERISPKIPVEEVRVPVDSFEEGAARILAALLKASAGGKKLIVNLSGGMRALIVEALTAAMLSGVEGLVVEVGAEDRRFSVEATLNAWRGMAIEGAQWRLMKALEGKLALSELAGRAGLPLSTAYRSTMALAKMGLVKAEKEGRKRLVSLTPIGRVLLMARGLKGA